MKTGMIFPGQASQFVGMGKDYYDRFASARELYREANSKLGFDITEISFSGSMEELTKTKNAQPAILLHSIVVLSILAERGVSPSVVAGHSLGEFSALAAAGFFRPMDALLIVRRRGELMYEAGLERPGTMAAIIGLEEAVLEECIEEASSDGLVVIANYNSPNQMAISGEVAAVESAVASAKERGAKRALKLNVSGAFHSPLMEESSRELIAYIEKFPRGKLRIPWIANVTGRIVDDEEKVIDLLRRQLTSPVLWVDCMKSLAATGTRRVLEVGPGRVLKGLMARIDRAVEVHPLSEADALEEVFKEA
jgi:[acyl-carrier-protein] S-malonyltransferase